MLAIDTNVLVRFFVKDNVEQAERVRDLFQREKIFVASTVILETEWVLRRGFGLPRAAIVESLKSLLGLSNIMLQDATALGKALVLVESGIDFADALHLSNPQSCDSFISFDKSLAKKSVRLGLPVREP